MGVEQASICGSPQSTNVHQNAQPGAQGVELHCRVLIQPCTRCFWCPVVAHGRVTPLSLFVFATLCVSLFPWSSLVAGMLLQLLFVYLLGWLFSIVIGNLTSGSRCLRGAFQVCLPCSICVIMAVRAYSVKLLQPGFVVGCFFLTCVWFAVRCMFDRWFVRWN